MTGVWPWLMARLPLKPGRKTPDTSLPLAKRERAPASAAALLQICFEGLELRRVYAQCFADNVPSRRIMERLGMRREQHTIKESLHRSGEWLDGMMYALLADEWASGPLSPL